jgi:hypothetical protein
MDRLRLDTLTFPVLRSSLSKLPKESSDYCWSIEIYCGASAGLEEQEESDLDYVLGAESCLYAQMLPLRVISPDDLVGRKYSFEQSPDGSRGDWEADQWPFFCLYLWEHDYIYPTTLAFVAVEGRRYRVEIEAKYPVDGKCYALRVGAWLEWEHSH